MNALCQINRNVRKNYCSLHFSIHFKILSFMGRLQKALRKWSVVPFRFSGLFARRSTFSPLFKAYICMTKLRHLLKKIYFCECAARRRVVSFHSKPKMWKKGLLESENRLPSTTTTTVTSDHSSASSEEKFRHKMALKIKGKKYLAHKFFRNIFCLSLLFLARCGKMDVFKCGNALKLLKLSSTYSFKKSM